MTEGKPAARSEPPSAKPRRGRGPNKPKPGAIEVRIEAVMCQRPRLSAMAAR